MIGVFRELWHIFKAYRVQVCVLVLLGFIGALLEGVGINAAIPLLSFFTNGGVPTSDTISHGLVILFSAIHIPFTFRYLLGFMLLLFFARAVSVALFYYIRSVVSSNFLASESNAIFSLLLNASWPYLLRQKIGHIQTLLVRDIQRASVLLDSIAQVIQSATGFVMYCAVAFLISPTMTLLALGGAAALILIVRPLLRRTVRAGEEMSQTGRDISQFLSEHVIGMKLVKASGVTPAALRAAGTLVRDMQQASLRMARVRSTSSSLFQPFSLLFVVVLFFIMYKTPGFSIITFATTLYLIQKIFTYAESAQSSLHGIGEFVPYVRSLEQFKAELVEAGEQVNSGTTPFVFNDSLELKGVSLSYEGKPALKDISVTIMRGESVGIIGPSGAGKTSLADLLLRLFEPQQGDILLDGVSMKDIAIDEWRTHVAYVPQEVFLFNTSVAENVRFYRPNISDEEVVEALKKANVYDIVAALPEGIQTTVGDRGVLLSGGQRQRVALARALVSSPALLVLDEATSALDTESERLIQEAIGSLRGSVTVIIIAHRLSTVDTADHILVLQDGRMTEWGTPQALRDNPDSYFSRHHD